MNALCGKFIVCLYSTPGTKKGALFCLCSRTDPTPSHPWAPSNWFGQLRKHTNFRLNSEMNESNLYSYAHNNQALMNANEQENKNIFRHCIIPAERKKYNIIIKMIRWTEAGPANESST